MRRDRHATRRPLAPRRAGTIVAVAALLVAGGTVIATTASASHRTSPARARRPVHHHHPATTRPARPVTTTTRAATRPTVTTRATATTGGTATTGATAGAGGTASHALGLWTPTARDTCSKALHDSFRTTGPDGKVYPTWHPPTVTDPATGRTCAFGHEHGLDPSGSKLWPWIQQLSGGLPFGFANERLLEAGTVHRHEDHVGHKVFWRNGVQLETSPGRARIGVSCDFLVKLHQGTHSPDAFTENAHELAYFVRCTDGTALAATVMSQIGSKGAFTRGCDKRTTVPSGGAADGRGARFIPDATCAKGTMSALYEDWITSNYLRTADGRQLAYFDPHFAVFNPSRFFDAGQPGNLGRTITLCGTGGAISRAGECQGAAGLAFDDPRSPFTGDHREVYFNQTGVTNAGGPTIWFTDPFGNKASRTAFPGSIAQFVSATSNAGRPTLESQAFGADIRPPASAGVHAPN